MATDTTSTNNKDAAYTQGAPTTTYGTSADSFYVAPQPSDNWRSVIHFTLPSGSGTITDVKLFLYKRANGGSSAWDINVHQLTQTGWTESGVCWNYYTGTTAWTTAGGDYNSTIIDSTARNTNTNEWRTWVLMGTGATNPLSLTWENEVHLLLKASTEDISSPNYEQYTPREYTADTTKRPYLEITYTEAGGGSARRLHLMSM